MHGFEKPVWNKFFELFFSYLEFLNNFPISRISDQALLISWNYFRKFLICYLKN